MKQEVQPRMRTTGKAGDRRQGSAFFPAAFSSFIPSIVTVALCCAAILASNDVFAGQYHMSADLICSDCHTIHYSEAGTTPTGAEGGGPFAKLLKASSTNALCLSCHDGSDTTAPDVEAPVTMYSGSGDEHSAAGYLASASPSDNAHDLSVVAATVPLSSMTNVTLTCAVCHDPHGTSNYRNLLTQPGAGAGTTVVLNTDVFQSNAPQIPPNSGATINAYKESNIGYASNMASWCAECHDTLNTNDTGSASAHFVKHPVDVSLDGGGYHTDTSHWTGGSGEGFGATTGDGSEGVPRMRFQVSGAGSYAAATTVSTSNQVFCGTCHLAHGSSYDSNTVWPHKTVGVDFYSPCQQCHFK